MSLTERGLRTILERITERDILITLPTSKDQLKNKGKIRAGYTEFFRSWFSNNTLSMFFKSPRENVLLLSDHVPLNQVCGYLTTKLIFEKTRGAIAAYEKFFNPLKSVIFAGINPHAGEGGLLGAEDKNIEKAIECLTPLFPHITFLGPFSGDTLHHHPKSEEIMQIYSTHDQALSKFKSSYGVWGANITLGLPFLRFSVDHGTAFDLYGKNRANYMGSLYLLHLTRNLHKKLRYGHQ